MKVKILTYLLFMIIFNSCKDEDSGMDAKEEEPQIVLEPQEPKLVWSDEFDVDGLPDYTKWTFDVGGHGFGNRELQYYTEKNLENVRIENGVLIIEALKKDFEGNQYTSGKIWTKDRRSWSTGRIEARIKLPSGKGTWPAFWMLPQKTNFSWPLDGEIDIMEHVGYAPDSIYGTIHTQAYNHTIGTQKGGKIGIKDVEKDFHIYAIEWTNKGIDWYVDDEKYYSLPTEKTYEKWPFSTNSYFVILNLAVGGTWGGAQGVDTDIWPQKMEVDYVRVYQ
ncbi:glycoside hydrolase family 16 protein [Flexithrix dorotheae]|uniref:glycoside hydrolase family 16 protein n=1 Tax=Flexithrix dorotheae TaxID=70993 RepID=UPI0003660573|nr:glycoside hydrolase family 16 protein [Flexithrix dorotheae]